MSATDDLTAATSPASPGTDDDGSAFGAWLLGRAVRVDDTGDRVLALGDPEHVVLVERGALDLFAARSVANRPVGRWTPIDRLGAGAVLALGSPPGPQHAVFARPVPGSLVSLLPAGRLAELAVPAGHGPRLAVAAAQLVRGIDLAVGRLDAALRDGLAPREFTALEPADVVTARAGEVLRSIAGVLWVEVLAGSLTGPAVPQAGTGHELVCLPEGGHLRVHEDVRLRVRSTEALLAAGDLPAALARHALRLGHATDRWVAQRTDQQRTALVRQAEQDALADRFSQASFSSLLVASTRRRGDLDAGAATDGARQVLARVARAAGVDLGVEEALWAGRAPGDERALVERLTDQAGVPTRSVRLFGRWWTRDCGPLVGYLKRDGRAVALLPVPGGYVLRDPHDARAVPLDPTSATRLRVEATMLYRSLPTGVAGLADTLRFGLRGSGGDGVRFAVTAAAVAAIGLLVPALTGVLLGTWVPAGADDLVVQGSLLVLASALVVAALTVVQNTAVLRLEGQLDVRLQAAVWHRLLSLPVSFFAQHPAAELGTRALGVSAVRETLSSVSTVAALGLVTALANQLLLLWYSVRLGLLALAMAALSAVVTVLLSRRGLRAQRELYRAEQRLASRSYQLLSGLSTLRLAAAESRAFAQWSAVLADSLRSSLTVRRSQAEVTVFTAGFSLVCTLVLFWLVGGPLRGELALPAFLAFLTAFNQMLAALLQLYAAASAALAVVPLVEGLRPILVATPERREGRVSPGDLAGAVAVRDVSFRYEDGPLVLDGVSFDVAPGEFVALVGGTGSGKSTILRILLGFDTPAAGSVLFDGQDMRQLDLRALRRQCGVVLQNGTLLAGDIATNIIGGTGYTVQDAWHAAELAGVADDIRAMPMGMHTVVPEGGSTLSGGQRQRLMIARALIASPRILFLDEATSALDNDTQRTVTESMRRLNASRLVIAHRLSTIEEADRVVVLEAGRVAEIGTYDELRARPGGAFARLVRRQLLEAVG